MDQWYSEVRKLKDASESPYQTEKLTRLIFHTLRRSKIRDRQKFRQRTGVEFDAWLNSLFEKYSEEMVREIISEYDFWGATLDALNI